MRYPSIPFQTYPIDFVDIDRGGRREMLEVEIQISRLVRPGDIDHPLRINHIVSIRFTAFAKAVNFFKCFYVDIDRTYFNDNSQGGAALTGALSNVCTHLKTNFRSDFIRPAILRSDCRLLGDSHNLRGWM